MTRAKRYLVTIFLLLTFGIPRLVSLFSEVGQSLPLPTRILISTSEGIRNYWYWILAIVFRGLAVKYRLIIAVAMEAVWEIIENTSLIINRYREATISLDYFGDSIINSMGDILVILFGFWIAYRFPIWFTIAIVIAIEIILAFLIRDGLMLNIELESDILRGITPFCKVISGIRQQWLGDPNILKLKH